MTPATRLAMKREQTLGLAIRSQDLSLGQTLDRTPGGEVPFGGVAVFVGQALELFCYRLTWRQGVELGIRAVQRQQLFARGLAVKQRNRLTSCAGCYHQPPFALFQHPAR